jgi:phenylalanyl-tRNA synthetase alpha chain
MEADLSLAEKRLLLALPRDGSAMGTSQLAGRPGFPTESEVLVAADRPQRLGLVNVAEEETELYRLEPEGLIHQAKGLPERRAVDALAGAGGRLRLADLKARAALSDEEAGVAIGWLRKKGWATSAKTKAGLEITLVGEAPEPGPDEILLAQLGREPRPIDSSPGLALLMERPALVTKAVQVRRLLSLTAGGKKTAGSLKPDDVEGQIEVGQFTPELVAKWPTMSAEERARHRIRPFDLSIAGAPQYPGKAHPLTHILTEIRDIFWAMGFQEISGDYVESAYWNMDALFIPQDHPARDMQDTFYLKSPARLEVAQAELDRAAAVHESGGGTGSTGWGGHFDRDVAQKALLRTHTTNTTIRYLAANPKGAHKVFGLGRVFRKETMDATHLPEFTQIEGIVTEPGCTFNTLVGLCRHFFGKMGFPQVRFRPAYFPYTEPSMEIEVFYNNRWMELGGCGIFRPEVKMPLGVENNVLAWGFGLERLAMMRLGLKDIRDLYISDVQWLRETPVR